MLLSFLSQQKITLEKERQKYWSLIYIKEFDVATVPFPENIPSGFGSRDFEIGTGLGTPNNSVPVDVLGLKLRVPKLTFGIYA